MRDNYVTTEAHAIFEDHAPVFRRVDNPIHWINLYPVDSAAVQLNDDVCLHRAWTEPDFKKLFTAKRKKICLSTPESVEKAKVETETKEKHITEIETSTSCCKPEPIRHKKTRRGKRKPRPKGLAAYEMGKPLGSGGFGEVFAARRKKDNLPVAIKFVNKSRVKNYREINGKQFPAEAYFQRHVRHPNVIQLLDIFTNGDNFVFVLERPEDSADLFDYIDACEGLIEDEGRELFSQILEAAIQCEEQGVLHQDIKPENVIIDMNKMEAKLTDFGLACDAQDQPFRQFVGTQHYCPPEFYSHRCFHGSHATVWQLGFLLAEMLSNEMPYVKPRMALYMHPSVPKFVSNEARNLISWMLSRDPDARPTLQQIRCHPWVSKPRHH
ncbi:unnamed protein product [Pocillopora meandrina]|uniref:Serine/threonine-protein kinase 1 n=1 Tax=Pocillopora meandrina TaxID=46732 RepID=A0AAU9XA77_9CNID|nr:unnamed protein product [Pocillopora meandrina]